MSSKPVYWNEGLFLRPHHFQAADRHDAAQRALVAGLALGKTAGIGEIDIDLDALANHSFQLKGLKALMPDGTLVNIPGETNVPARPFKAELDRDGSATVSLALPTLSMGRPNNLPPGGAEPARCTVEPASFEDENDGQRPEEILVRRLSPRLLLQGERADGLAVLPLARVVRSNRPDGAPTLDPDFYPPVFRCDAYGPLSENIVRYLLNRVGRKATGLATQLRAGGMGLGAREPLLIAQLNALNAAQGALHALANDSTATTGQAYAELCRLVGALAFTGENRLLPALPALDHGEPHKALVPLRRIIEEYLDRVVEPEFKDRPFIGAGLRMQVSLEPSWLEPDWGMFIGVQSDLAGEEVVRIITTPGILDMKVGSAEQVDGIYRAGKAGMSFTTIKTPPRVLPPGITYFQLAREASGAEWGDVKRTLSLAVRFNENRVQGNIQDRQELALSIGGKNCRIQFTLFVVAPKSMS